MMPANIFAQRMGVVPDEAQPQPGMPAGVPGAISQIRPAMPGNYGMPLVQQMGRPGMQPGMQMGMPQPMPQPGMPQPGMPAGMQPGMPPGQQISPEVINALRARLGY